MQSVTAGPGRDLDVIAAVPPAETGVWGSSIAPATIMRWRWAEGGCAGTIAAEADDEVFSSLIYIYGAHLRAMDIFELHSPSSMH
jgi:hypothetical protein